MKVKVYGNLRRARQLPHGTEARCGMCGTVIPVGGWRFRVERWYMTMCCGCKRWYTRLMSHYRGKPNVQDEFDKDMADVIELARRGVLNWRGLAPLMIEKRRAENAGKRGR